MGRLIRGMIGLLLPLALAGCVLAPGKFVSRLTINADRTFTFSYVGEVIAVDLASEFGEGLGKSLPDDNPAGDVTEPGADDGSDPTLSPALWKIAARDGKSKDRQSKDDGTDEAETAAKKAATEAKNKAIAEALSKEAGYRKVTYRGNGKFDIDYQISGTLTHSFVYPYNVDANAIFPFIVIEVRANNSVRVKAPAFANDDKSKDLPGADQASGKLDGTFTLDTDAEIVSQNNEDGAVSAGGRKTVTWKATPLSKTAPMAVLRFK